MLPSEKRKKLSHPFTINFWILSYLKSELMPLLQKAHDVPRADGLAILDVGFSRSPIKLQ
jgi:hypothetical protein